MKRNSIVTRIALTASLSLIVFAAGMLVLIRTQLEHAIYDVTGARVRVAQNMFFDLIRAKGEPSLRGGTLRLGGWVANGDNSLVDHVRAVAGADATLFALVGGKPIRITTTITNARGSRIVGTELVGPARVAFDAGRSFAGVSPIAGRSYLNRYDALLDRNGKVIGIVYTGVPLTSLYAVVSGMMRWVLVGTGVALVVGLASLYLVMRPLRLAFGNAVDMAQGLAAGEVDQPSRTVTNDELGEVHVAFEQMIRYQQRMAGIADALASGDFSVDVTPVSERDRLGVAFASMSRNLNDLMQRLELSAMTDSLTQLGNRRAFDLRMRAELSRVARSGGALSLAVVDVDHFKAVNDAFGHQHGDAVLSKLALVLRRVRAEDSVYRLGGDEFAVILTDKTAADARLALERIRELAQAELLGATVTIGVATALQNFTDAEALHRQADAALYVGKQRGRNSVVAFDDAQSRSAIPQHMNVDSLQRLIAERALEVGFAPIWDLRRCAVLGFEATASPASLYALSGASEAFRVATRVGRAHELDSVCREAIIARSDELPAATLLFLSVAPETLARDVLQPEALASAFAAVGVSPERVVLEITERFERPPDSLFSAATTLQRFGFKLALDDIGAGTASLAYLGRFRADFIKIDATTVANAVHDMAARATISAVFAIARATGSYVIAKGIDDESTLAAFGGPDPVDRFQARERQGLQGDFLGRPAPSFSMPDRAAIASRLRRLRPTFA